MPSASGAQIQTNGWTIQYTHIMTLFLMLHSVQSNEEEGQEYFKKVLWIQPLSIVIMYQTNGKARLINTLR